MNPFKAAFEAGTQRWIEQASSSDPVELRRTILQFANHDGVRFRRVDFTGTTLRDCCFTNCEFVDCTFTGCAFEGSSFHDAVFASGAFECMFFRQCTLSRVSLEGAAGLELHFDGSSLELCELDHLRLKSLLFASCRQMDCRISASFVDRIEVQDCSLIPLSLDRPGRVRVSLVRCTGTVELQKATVSSLAVTGCPDLHCLLRDVVVAHLEAPGLTERIRVDAIQAMILDSDLNGVNLERSTLVSSALVGCRWPDSEGTTSWSGKFHIPRNLIAQPIGDVSGVPESVRRSILRAQVLASWEKAGQQSWFTWLLHRTVGVSTAHGRSPQRLLVVAYAIALLEAVVGQVLAHFDWVKARFVNPQTLSMSEALETWGRAVVSGIPATLRDSLGYFSAILSLENRFSQELNPFLSGASTVVGVILLGILVGLIVNRISTRG